MRWVVMWPKTSEGGELAASCSSSQPSAGGRFELDVQGRVHDDSGVGNACKRI